MAVMSAAFLGAVAGLGLLLAGLGVRGHAIVPSARRRSGPADRTGSLLARGLLALVAGTTVLALTSWLVAAGAAAAAAAWSPTALRHRRGSTDEIVLVEAVATWTEQLRDTIAGAAGLEQAVVTTAAVAPVPLAGPVAGLAGRIGVEPTPVALRRFADEVGHPSADFVVAALVTAAQHQARDLAPLLGRLAAAARADAQMHRRVWVARARTRSAVRIIAVVVVTFVLGLLLWHREYLRVYGTAVGQVVLAAVLATFAGSLWGLQRLAEVDLPERFVTGRTRPSAPVGEARA